RKKQVSRPHRMEARVMLGKLSGQITETVQNLTTLRAFGGEAHTLRAHLRLADENREVRMRQHRVEWRYNTWVDLAEGVGTVLVLSVVAYQALNGAITVGGIVLVALYLQQVVGNLRPMATFIDTTGELLSTCEHMLALLAVEPTVKDRPDAQVLETLESVEFRGVSFHYPAHEQMVLRDVSFTIRKGQMLALVGPSGTGKTTLVKLLLRLYDPTGGEVLINGRDVREFTADSVRAHMGTVMQDVALFNDSLTANVLMASPDATEGELANSMKLAHADEFARQLPDGYNTLVGERGVKLSGGQKQRVAIARAILKQPGLVVLDEATSALDSASERQVQAGLTQLLRGRMAVVIAHRLSTVAAADLILVIKNGRVIEEGHHAELVARGGLYAKLFKLQSS
ncbi:MAG TPA: ABC transporter ATP-binding protein, partial [Candidatus Saccharimonadia bacterium]|nr:ABC transporter ATP-binding protein [Candidatus Saccharimonadia bacterium]